MKKLSLLLFFTLTFITISCLNNETKINSSKKTINKSEKTRDSVKKFTNSETSNNLKNEIKNVIDESELIFPEKGENASDFLPNLKLYQIQYEVKGDLNNDNLEDIVVVIKNKKIKTVKRPMLILLQQEDKSYILDKISKVAMPVEYNDYDFKMYDDYISIENNELHINFFEGPGIYINSIFKYFENELKLTYLDESTREFRIEYDFLNDEITTYDSNSIRSGKEAKAKKSKTKLNKHLFEKTSITEFND